MAVNRLALPKPKKRAPKNTAVAQSTNGHGAEKKISTPIGVSSELARILQPQAAYRWLLPYVASITPYYIESILRGALVGDHVRQWELFDLMLDTWPELSAISQELTIGLQRKRLIFEPFREEDQQPTPSAIEKMKVVSGALRSMRPNAAADENDLDALVTDLMDGWFRGVTAQEIDWQMVDLGSGIGQTIGPRCTFWVHPTCFGWSRDGVLGLRNPQGSKPGSFGSPFSVTSTPASDIQEFPPDKFLVGIHKAKSGTALGGSLLRPLAWWWCAANFSADWLMNLAQVFGLPFRWANYDANAPQATIDAICNMLQNMGSAGWAAFPAGTTLEMKEAARAGSDHSPQGELLDRADRYARTLILGQTMTGGAGTTGKGGGQAFGTIEADVKDDRIDAAGRYVAGVINGQLIESILNLNYGEATESPTLRFLEEEEAKLETAQRDQVLAGMGLKFGSKFLRKKYGIPEPEPDEETIGGQAEPDPNDPAPSKPNQPNDKKDPLEAKGRADGFDHYLGASKEAVAKEFKGDLQPLVDAIEISLAGKSEEEQHINLIRLQPKLAPLARKFGKEAKSPFELALLMAKEFSTAYTQAEEARS